MISGDRRNVTLSSVSSDGHADEWVYALAVNSGPWSSGLMKVKCLLDATAPPETPEVKIDAYKQTPSSVTLVWSSEVCDTLVVQSYHLRYSPTNHTTGLNVLSALPSLDDASTHRQTDRQAY